MKVTKMIEGKTLEPQKYDELIIEINGGDQEFALYELEGELVIKKIERNQPNRKSRERLVINPCFRDQIRVH